MKLLLLTIISFLSLSTQAGVEEGLEAFQAGDHKTAIFNYKEALKEK